MSLQMNRMSKYSVSNICRARYANFATSPLRHVTSQSKQLGNSVTSVPQASFSTETPDFDFNRTLVNPVEDYSAGRKYTGDIGQSLGLSSPLVKPFHPTELKPYDITKIVPAKETSIITDGNGATTNIAYAMSESAFIFPITPSSTMAEQYDSWVGVNRRNIFGDQVEVTEMQSEAGAIGSLHGVLVAGSLCTTFTSSQGLLLMLPNLYQISGSLFPCVIHVATRYISINATSICGDHTDIMGVRSPAWAILSSSSVQEASDFALCAHLATLKSSVPFFHMFEGFQLSHQVTDINVPTYDEMKQLVPNEAIQRLRARALSPVQPKRYNSSSSRDTCFQLLESQNVYYETIPEIVQDTFTQIEKLTGRKYRIFDYYGDPDATDVVVSMGANCTSVNGAVDYLRKQGKKVGSLVVHLFRPWSEKYFLKALPKTVERIAVLDRTKELSSIMEPLAMDVSVTLRVGRPGVMMANGRYGLSEKLFGTNQAIGVFNNLASDSPKMTFTVGINDDLTNLSVDVPNHEHIPDEGTRQCIFWGMGGDGTVGSNKQAMEIVNTVSGLHAQAQFVYSAHKSGAVTVSHVRLSKNTIYDNSLIGNGAQYIGCHSPSYLTKFDLTAPIATGGTFVLNTPLPPEEVMRLLPPKGKKRLAVQNANFYIIDADKVARQEGLTYTSMIMQSVFFSLFGLMSKEEATKHLKDSVVKRFGKKYVKEVTEKNLRAIDAALVGLTKVNYPKEEWAKISITDEEQKKLLSHPLIDLVPDNLKKFIEDVQKPSLDRRGEAITVSQLNPDGCTPLSTAQFEKRAIALEIPDWIHRKCVQCNICSLVCPHAAIRPSQLTTAEAKAAPEGYKLLPSVDVTDHQYHLQVSPKDCTGCSVCALTCPEGALTMQSIKERLPIDEPHYNYSTTIPVKETLLDKFTVKGSQYQQPLLEFSGACDGCAETPYAKLLTQLFGTRMLISQATGCASVWGSFYSFSAYCQKPDGVGPAFVRSLFEDAAEVGYGVISAILQRRDYLKIRIKKYLEQPGSNSTKLGELLTSWIKNSEQPIVCDQLVAPILSEIRNSPPTGKDDEASQLLEYIRDNKDLFPKPCQWIFGGDGWATDINSSGLEHILHLDKNFNVLVMDNEVYANTGGQSSKSTPIGAIAKFASVGKRTHKSDLGIKYLMNGKIYVGCVSLSHPEHLVQTLIEAEAYDGPSIVMGYCPCRDHVVSLSKTVQLCQMAVSSGYWTLYRYNPNNEANPLSIDSHAVESVEPFLMEQGRYKLLAQNKPEIAKDLFTRMKIRNKRKADLLAFLAQGMSSNFSIKAAGAEELFHPHEYEVFGKRIPSSVTASTSPLDGKLVRFAFNGLPAQGIEGEPISSALVAAGFPPVTKSANTSFCGTGDSSCNACEMSVNGSNVKACKTQLQSGMKIASSTSDKEPISNSEVENIEDDDMVVVVGAGGYGLAASEEISRHGYRVLLCEENHLGGGKLVAQNQKQFGNTEFGFAGQRGTDIVDDYNEKIRQDSKIHFKLGTSCYINGDKVQMSDFNGKYEIEPLGIINATGATDKVTDIEGGDLQGVYSSSAFQNFLIRDWVKPVDKIVVIGSDNAALISAYQAIQNGIEVEAIVDNSENIEGYQVYEDLLKRFGVKFITKSQVVRCDGETSVLGVVVKSADEEIIIPCNGVVYSSKASMDDSTDLTDPAISALKGKAAALRILSKLENHNYDEQIKSLEEKANKYIVKERIVHPNASISEELKTQHYPAFKCNQEFPCNVCHSKCPQGVIAMTDVSALPSYAPSGETQCDACEICVSACPGQAIKLMKNNETSVLFPYEFDPGNAKSGAPISVMDENGESLGQYPMEGVSFDKITRTYLVSVKLDPSISEKAQRVEFITK